MTTNVRETLQNILEVVIPEYHKTTISQDVLDNSVDPTGHIDPDLILVDTDIDLLFSFGGNQCDLVAVKDHYEANLQQANADSDDVLDEYKNIDDENFKTAFRTKAKSLLAHFNLVLGAYSNRLSLKDENAIKAIAAVKTKADQEDVSINEMLHVHYAGSSSGDQLLVTLLTLEVKNKVNESKEFLENLLITLGEIQSGSKAGSALYWAMNMIAAFCTEAYTEFNLWAEYIDKRDRTDIKYDYERINRALARKDDATGDVAQIEQIVNSFITSGVKNTENKPEINFSPQVDVKPEINVQPCQPCPETPAEGTPSGS